jgi:hypothetical protein
LRMLTMARWVFSGIDGYHKPYDRTADKNLHRG